MANKNWRNKRSDEGFTPEFWETITIAYGLLNLLGKVAFGTWKDCKDRVVYVAPQEVMATMVTIAKLSKEYFDKARMMRPDLDNLFIDQRIMTPMGNEIRIEEILADPRKILQMADEEDALLGESDAPSQLRTKGESIEQESKKFFDDFVKKLFG